MIHKPDRIYLVHYTKLVDRLEKIKPILDKTGVPWEIISLHDKEALIEDSSKLYRKDPEVFQNKINSLYKYI